MKTPSFWLWFMANEKTLRGINHLNKRKRNKLIYWLSKHLEYYNPKIGFRLIVPYENQGTPSIAFSAGKNLEVRPHILHLAECLQLFRLLDTYLKKRTQTKNKLHEEDVLGIQSKYVYKSLQRDVKH